MKKQVILGKMVKKKIKHEKNVFLVYCWVIFLFLLLTSGLVYMNPLKKGPYDYPNVAVSNDKSIIGWGLVALSIILGYITKNYWKDEMNRWGGASVSCY